MMALFSSAVLFFLSMGAGAAYDALGEAVNFRIRRYILSCR